ncbi:MAG: hypothetical protein ACTSRV_17245 [Candidatus Freyarchaeota archaeon]
MSITKVRGKADKGTGDRFTGEEAENIIKSVERFLEKTRNILRRNIISRQQVKMGKVPIHPMSQE